MSPAVRVVASAAALLAVDQATKTLALRYLRAPRSQGRAVGPRLVLNRAGCGGASFGWRSMLSLFGVNLVVVLLLVESGFIFNAAASHIALGAALGGAAGNLVDRMFRGVVIDFIDLLVWPVFNVADGAIVVGSVIATIFAI